MASSTLGRVIELFEEEQGVYSLTELASRLNLSTEQVESMLDFWVKKGRLKKSSANTDQCSGCFDSNRCPFILELPETYELVEEEGKSSIKMVPPVHCRH